MANVPTVSWSETTPAGSDDASAGDNRIRELKTQIREIVNVDHDFPSSGQAADNGQHKQVTLQEQADLGTGAAGATILGNQTVSGKGELIYTDEDDNDIQMTNLGAPLALTTLAAKTTPVAADLMLICDTEDDNISKKITMANILNAIYPVGIILTLGVSTNPGTLIGIGTWTAIAGKVIVGINASDAEFDTLDETGGAKTANLAHTHNVPAATDTGWGTGSDCASNGRLAVGGADGGDGAAPYASNDRPTGSGGSATQSILQPYIVKYVWQRTA